MLDISPSGCQVQLQYGRLKVGESVTVQPQGLEGLPGFVRWFKGSRAGIEFSPPLHPSVANNLAKATYVEDNTGGRCSFGTAHTLGKRLLPPPTVSILRSVL